MDLSKFRAIGLSWKSESDDGITITLNNIMELASDLAARARPDNPSTFSLLSWDRKALQNLIERLRRLKDTGAGLSPARALRLDSLKLDELLFVLEMLQERLTDIDAPE